MKKIGRPSVHPIKRIRAKTIKVNGCWIYTGTPSNIYPTFSDEEGNNRAVHRYIYEKIKRKRLSNDILVCHTCDTPRCWRPSHLFEGTSLDNVNDAVNKGRNVKRERHGCAKLDSKQVDLIRGLYSTGRYTYERLGSKFGVTESAIGAIIRQETWVEEKG